MRTRRDTSATASIRGIAEAIAEASGWDTDPADDLLMSFTGDDDRMVVWPVQASADWARPLRRAA